jgi:hemerythrin
MAVEWTEDLAVGVGVIDDQHKELFRRVDGLLEACKAGKGRQSVGEMLEFLGDYVVTHFSAEENIQLHYAYPNYKLHKAMHESFISDVENLKKKFEAEGATLTMVLETNRVVVDWLVKHIKKADMDLGSYLKSHGYLEGMQ